MDAAYLAKRTVNPGLLVLVVVLVAGLSGLVAGCRGKEKTGTGASATSSTEGTAATGPATASAMFRAAH